jgi:hypothetical protein
VKRPSIPGFLLGCIGVSVPKVNIFLGVLGIPLAYVGMLAGQWALLSIGIGTLSVMPIAVSLQWLGQRRIERMTAGWPTQVQVMRGPEGERIAFVTTNNGTVSTVILPEHYSPEDDGGEWLIREVAPDLAAMLFTDDEEAAE